MSETFTNTNGVAIPTVEQMQAAANARVHAEVTSELGQLRFDKASAEAVADGWRYRAEALAHALAAAQEEQAAARQEAAHHQAVGQSHAEEAAAALDELAELHVEFAKFRAPPNKPSARAAAVPAAPAAQAALAARPKRGGKVFVGRRSGIHVQHPPTQKEK